MNQAAGHWETWRTAFSQVIEGTSIGELLKAASLSGQLGHWTNEVTSAVVKACQSIGWDAAARWNPSSRLPIERKEYLAIDVMALPSTQASESAWPMPIAVFELENSKQEDKVAYSLWKVLAVRAELRVVFAYRQDWPQSRSLVENLQAAIIGPMSPADRESIGGETVVVVGNRGEGETFPWGYFKAWRLDANLGRFEKI